MSDALEPQKKIVEIWITAGTVRYRVYRGWNPAHIKWKLEHHRASSPEVIEIKG